YQSVKSWRLRVNNRRPILLRFSRFAHHFAKDGLQRAEIAHRPALIGLRPGLGINIAPVELVTRMDSQLFKEDALRNTIADTEWMQDVNFTIIMTQAGDKLLWVQPHEVRLILQILHQ